MPNTPIRWLAWCIQVKNPKITRITKAATAPLGLNTTLALLTLIEAATPAPDHRILIADWKPLCYGIPLEAPHATRLCKLGFATKSRPRTNQKAPFWSPTDAGRREAARLTLAIQALIGTRLQGSPAP